jgi:hypothetical protein
VGDSHYESSQRQIGFSEMKDEETVNNDMISSISKALHSPRNQQDEGEYREEDESVVIKDRVKRHFKQSKTLG